jgi:hypothetical protein
MSSPVSAPVLSYKYKKKEEAQRQTGVMCTREATVPKGDGGKKRIKSSLSTRYLRKEIYIS